MKITPTSIPEVLLIEPDVYSDSRGFFLESWHYEKFADQGLDVQFVQDNHSRSSRGVLRGLHYQLEKPQGKLVRIVNGAVFDAAVDIRLGSPTFGLWVGVILSGDNHRQLYIPPGFAHGFSVISDTADFLYRCTDYYAPQFEHGIIWNDPDLAIDWPEQDHVISEKDQQSSRLKDMHDVLPVYGDRS